MTHEEGLAKGWKDYPTFSKDLDISEDELVYLHETANRPMLVAWYNPRIDDYLFATNNRHGYDAYQAWLANNRIGMNLFSSNAKNV